jgi:aspartate/methionine/tyrosine aminotransferase
MNTCTETNINWQEIDLSKADTFDGATERFKLRLSQSLDNTQLDRYASSPRGEPKLREAIVLYYAATYGVWLDPETDVCVVSGGQQALDLAMRAVGQESHLVSYLDPVFAGISTVINAASKQPNPIHIDKISDDLSTLSNLFQDCGGSIFVLNSPHNPTGRILSPKHLQSIAQIAEMQSITVISDFVFGEVYEIERPCSYLAFDPLALEIGSMSKTFSMSGWRCGFIVGKGDCIKRVIELQKKVDNGVPPAIQIAVSEILNDRATIDKNRLRIAERRHCLVRGLRQLGFHVEPL